MCVRNPFIRLSISKTAIFINKKVLVINDLQKHCF
jgi:hypothetical protein